MLQVRENWPACNGSLPQKITKQPQVLQAIFSFTLHADSEIPSLIFVEWLEIFISVSRAVFMGGVSSLASKVRLGIE